MCCLVRCHEIRDVTFAGLLHRTRPHISPRRHSPSGLDSLEALVISSHYTPIHHPSESSLTARGPAPVAPYPQEHEPRASRLHFVRIWRATHLHLFLHLHLPPSLRRRSIIVMRHCSIGRVSLMQISGPLDSDSLPNLPMV